MKKYQLFLLLSVICACASAAPTNSSAVLSTKKYEPSLENFANPERGFYQQEGLLDEGIKRNPLNINALLKARTEGVSTLRLYIRIDEFLTSDINADTLSFLTTEFAKVRQAGLKIIPRFTYNFPSGGSFPFKDPDASLEWVLKHLDQLESLLKNNADILSFMEAGFIGAWGEWHSSTNQLVDSNGVNAASKAIVKRILEILPKSRMMALRYPKHKQQIFGTAPLDLTQAFAGSEQARVGAINDCFLASKTDWGTYPENAAARETIKTFLELDNRFLPQGGETCNANAEAQPFIGCENALIDLQRMKYTTLNRGYHKDVYAKWQQEECLEEVKRRLGYRFELLETTMPETMKANQALNLKIGVKNTGFATPFNPRGFALILRGKKTYELNITNGQSIPENRLLDPRFWTAGQTTQLETTLTLPTDLEAGQYDVLLHFYDPETTLKNKPEFAIQLANQGIWEAQTGFNKIRTLEILP
jgi:hypothetical protein